MSSRFSSRVIEIIISLVMCVFMLFPSLRHPPPTSSCSAEAIYIITHHYSFVALRIPIVGASKRVSLSFAYNFFLMLMMLDICCRLEFPISLKALNVRFQLRTGRRAFWLNKSIFTKDFLIMFPLKMGSARRIKLCPCIVWEAPSKDVSPPNPDRAQM